MQMIDVLKRLAELDAQNPNIVSEISQGLAAKTYNKMADGGDDSKNRTGLAGDQSDRLKARMDKRWGKDASDAAVQKDREHGVEETSWLDGRQQSDDELVWKQTSLSVADAVAQYGKENVKVDGKNRLGQPVVSVKVPLVSKEGVAESLEECGMMGGMSQPHSPASINMTAATGEELSSMLKDIMTLAGRPMQEPMGGEEPMGGADGVAVVDVEPSPEVGADDTSVMRSMIDKLNPSDDGDSDAGEQPSDDDEEEEKVDEYDNSPEPTTAGYDAAVPSGNDLHKEKTQYPAAQRGDNPMAATFEGLMAEYQKFIREN